MTSLLDELAGLIYGAEPTRRVFFSLHYQRDIWRAQHIKQHWVTKETRTAAGFFDGSLEEKAKKEGADEVKRLINRGLVGASVTCVLIGAETYSRRWVDYEILKSIEEGMGVFGVCIHGLKNRDGQRDKRGPNPFHYLGYGVRPDERLQPMVRYTSGWKNAPHNGVIPRSAAPYLQDRRNPVLDDIFSVYDWIEDDGFNNFNRWVAAAARQAGR